MVTQPYIGFTASNRQNNIGDVSNAAPYMADFECKKFTHFDSRLAHDQLFISITTLCRGESTPLHDDALLTRYDTTQQSHILLI